MSWGMRAEGSWSARSSAALYSRIGQSARRARRGLRPVPPVATAGNGPHYGMMARTVMGVNFQTTASSVIDPAEWVESAAREHPQRLFLRTPAGQQLSYEALLEQSARVASALMRRGVVCGDRVAARVEKSPQAVLLYVACLRLGAVFVPINPACTPNELDYLLCDSSPRLAIVPPGERDMLGPVADRAGLRCLDAPVGGREWPRG